MAATTIKEQGLASTTRLASKIITATRDAGAASGDVSYTGVGFMPTKITAISNVDGTLYYSHGYVSQGKEYMAYYQTAADVIHNENAVLVNYSNWTSWANKAIVKSFDADGFTLTWTKVGTPTAGTISLSFLCER